MAQYHYTAVFEPAVEGGYIVSVPALPGLVTEGDTIEEARAMVKDAIRGYIESLVKHGERHSDRVRDCRQTSIILSHRILCQ